MIPPEAPEYKSLGGFHAERDFKAQGKIVRRAHVVTATSAYLAERYASAWGVEPVVIENYLGDHHFPRERASGEGLVIGWVAAGEHRADAHHLNMTQVLRQVMERDPRVRVVTLGVQLKLDPERYTHHQWVPFEELPRHLAGFDIGIAPIADIPFNLARSNVKVKEYAAAGVPWVASARGPYADLGSRCGGMIIGDDAWEDTLVSLAGAGSTQPAPPPRGLLGKGPAPAPSHRSLGGRAPAGCRRGRPAGGLSETKHGEPGSTRPCSPYSSSSPS